MSNSRREVGKLCDLCNEGNYNELKAAATAENCNKQDRDGWAPLHWAARVSSETLLEGMQQCATLLLNLGADPNLQNNNGDTPLFNAIDSNSGDMIRLLVSKGADVNYVNREMYNWTPLMWASINGKLAAVQALLQLGARVDLKDKFGESARDKAEEKQHQSVVELLDEFERKQKAEAATNSGATQSDAVVHRNKPKPLINKSYGSAAASATSSPQPGRSVALPTNKSQAQLPAAASARSSPKPVRSITLPTNPSQNQFVTEATEPANSKEKEYYPTSKPQGICVIVNVSSYHSNTDFSERTGSQHDVASVESTFKSLQFEIRKIESKQGLTSEEIFYSLTDIGRLDHSRYSSFVCFLMAHGSEGAIYGANGVPLSLDKILSLFSPDTCPSLKGKPKLFFIQACRGTVRQHLQASGIRHDSHLALDKEATPLKADFFIGFANVENEPAYRDEDNGSIFVSTLCSVLRQKNTSKDLGHVMTRVTRIVANTPIPGEDGVYCKAVIEGKTNLTYLMSFDPDSKE